MSGLQEAAVQMIGGLSDDNVKYVIEFIQSLTLEKKEKPVTSRKKQALRELDFLRKNHPISIDDYDKERMEALEEKYGCFG